MTYAENLWLYFIVVFGVVLLPGLDMAFVLASSLVGGRRAGLAALAGCAVGGAAQMTLGMVGIALVLRTLPQAFNALLLAGSAYLVWIGVSLLRSRDGLTLHGGGGDASAATAFRRAVLTNLLNPKAHLFVLAILPQFVKPEYGSIAAQGAVLVAIGAASQLVVYGVVVWLGAQVRERLAARPEAGVRLARLVGATLIAAAVFTAFEGWRRM